MSKHRQKQQKRKKFLKRIKDTQQGKDIEQEKRQKIYNFPFINIKYVFSIVLAVALVYVLLNVLLPKIFISIDPHFKAAVTDLLTGQKEGLQARYPFGYKILSLDKNRIVKSYHDTLPENFRVNWEELRFINVDPELKRENPLAAKLIIPSMNFQPKNIRNLSLAKIITHQKGAVIPIIDLGSKKLTLEISEINEKGSVLIFGMGP